MPVNDAVPVLLLNQVASVFHPRRIILFGSRARGDAHEDSDIDLVVELDNDVAPEMMSAKVIHSARAGYREPVDILPCRESVLKEWARAIGSFAHTTLTEGVVVYEKSCGNGRKPASGSPRQMRIFAWRKWPWGVNRR